MAVRVSLSFLYMNEANILIMIQTNPISHSLYDIVDENCATSMDAEFKDVGGSVPGFLDYNSRQ